MMKWCDRQTDTRTQPFIVKDYYNYQQSNLILYQVILIIFLILQLSVRYQSILKSSMFLMNTKMGGTLLIISIFMTCGSMCEGFSTFKRGKMSHLQKEFSKNIVKPDSSNIGFDPALVCRWQMFLASQVNRLNLNRQRQYWVLSGCSGLLAGLECLWPGLVPRLHGGQALWWLPWWDMC